MFFHIVQLRKMQPRKQGLTCGNIRPLQLLNSRKVMMFVPGILLPTGKPTSKTQRRTTRRMNTLPQMQMENL